MLIVKAGTRYQPPVEKVIRLVRHEHVVHAVEMKILGITGLGIDNKVPVFTLF